MKYQKFFIKYGFLILMAVLFIVFEILTPSFWNAGNLYSILLGVTVYGILALGMTFTMIVEDMDLSIGSTAALSVMLSSYIMVIMNQSGFIAVVACLIVGVLIGLFNAFLIVKMKIPAVLATLGTMFLIQGLQLIPSAGRSIGNGVLLENGETAKGVFSEGFKFIGQGRILNGIPVPVVILLVLAIVIYVVLSLTRWGRIFYAIGSNQQAARLIGTNVNLFRTVAYVICGTVAALGGIILSARVGRGDVTSNSGVLMDAVASALIGYAVLGVRKPNPFGSIVGAIFISMLLNGLTMVNMPYYVQDFIKGVVLIAALAFVFGLSKKEA
jgi:simple sugar transport system permease protein